MGLAGFWSVAGLVVLASASWWVALREMGDGGFYLSRWARAHTHDASLLYAPVHTQRSA